MKRSRASLFEVGIKVAPLESQRGSRGEESLDEATAACAVITKAAFPHQDGKADGALGGVVCCLEVPVVWPRLMSALQCLQTVGLYCLT